MDNVINIVKAYWDSNMIGFIIDVAIVLILGVLLVVAMFKATKKKIVILCGVAYLIIVAAGFCFNLVILPIALCAICVAAFIFMMFMGGFKKPEAKVALSQSVAKLKNKNENAQSLKEAVIEYLVETVEYFSSRKIGAIITIEGNDSLEMYMKSACRLDSDVTSDLLKTIFFPNTALHDGAVIIRNGRIACAAAFYTPSVNKDLPTTVGSRHRAALGISESTDAFTLVVSEETGKIKSTYQGVFSDELSEELIRTALNEHLNIN